MTKEEVNKLIATYIVAIGRSGGPNSHIWMAIDTNMNDLDLHLKMVGVLKAADLLTESHNFLKLTEKGLALFDKIEALYLPKKPTIVHNQ